MMAASRYSVLEGEVRDLLENGLGKFLTDLTDGSGQHQPSIVLGQQLSKAFRSYYDLKAKLEKDSLDCAVLALTKSGKSTILNALCGASILPSNNVPETARIVALEHCNLGENSTPTLNYKVNGESVEVEGEEQIRCHLEILNKNVRGRKHSKDDEQIITVRTQLAALQTEPQNLAVGLRLLDTPGPNEAGEDALRHSVERLLDSVDAVVYILDYTKLKTQEEADLLTKLSKSNPQLIMRLAQRLFFVVNKIDVMHTSEGLQEDELREYVADLVTKQMNFPSFQLRPEQVLLVSAEDALLSRLILAEKATQRQRERFARKHFGRNAKAKHSDAEYIAGAESLLDESRMLDLEECLLGYLYNHAGSLKIVSLLDGIAKLLTQLKNVAVTGKAAMKVSSGTLVAEMENLQTSLANTSEEFKAVQKQASGVEANVINDIQARMLNLKERLFLHIEQVLDPSASPPPAEAHQQSGWQRIRAKCAGFFTRSKTQESNSDAALKAKLSDLHSDIKRQIDTEITEFWHDLETATNQTYQELISVINQHLLDLARKIEGSVGKVLDLCLKPLDICLQRPSAEEFHSSIQDLLRKGIKHGQRRETRHREEDKVEWQKRTRGLCNVNEYYVGIPVKRRVTYHEDVPVFSLDPDSIKEHFNTMVEQSISVSIKNVRDYVHLFMSDQIEKAHVKISSYSALYADAMQSALAAKTLSAFEQLATVAALEENIAALEELLGKANHIAQTASNRFPQLEIDSYDWVMDDHDPLAGFAGIPLTEDTMRDASSLVKPVVSADRGVPVDDVQQEISQGGQLADGKLVELGRGKVHPEKYFAVADSTSSDEGADSFSETDYGKSDVSEEGTVEQTDSEVDEDLSSEEEEEEEAEETDSEEDEETDSDEDTEEDFDEEEEDDDNEEDDEDDDADLGHVPFEESFPELAQFRNLMISREKEEEEAQANGQDVQPMYQDNAEMQETEQENDDLEIILSDPPVVPEQADGPSIAEEPLLPPLLPLSDLPDVKDDHEDIAVIDHLPARSSSTGSSSGMKSARSGALAPQSSDHDSSDWECLSESEVQGPRI